jgi:lysozyme
MYEVSTATLELIKGFEGEELTAYQDQVGVWTIGVGITYYQNGMNVKKGDVITQAESTTLFTWMAQSKLDAINPYIPLGLNDHQVGALLSLAYNIGDQGLIDSTVLRLVTANKQDPAIKSAFLLWDKGHIKGKLVTLTDLLVRRTKEANYYFS